MTFKPSIWRPIALGLAALNYAGAGFAIALNEGPHAGIHVLAGLAFGYWASRLKERGGEGGRLESVEAEMMELREQLAELQERMDFAERLLAQGAEREQERIDRGE